MQVGLQTKLKAMLWDMPENRRSELSAKILTDPVHVFQNDEQLLIWEDVFNEASNKDIWINPINAAEILEQFPTEKIQEIVWVKEAPSNEWFIKCINQIIPDILIGGDNTLYNQSR